MIRPYSLAEVQFQLGDEIGVEGRNSRVFRAHDPQLNAELVIKRVEKATISDIDQYFDESSLLYRGAHSNVVPIHYACQDADHIFLAMPYYANGSLKMMMSRQMLTIREIIVVATQFLSGLHHIHSNRLIHFDIKPDNILISGRGEALLSDFGLAKQTTFSGHAGQDRIYGKMTPPEAFATDQFTNRFDIYQVGLTLYRMCVGDNEFYRQYNVYMDNGVLDRAVFMHAVRNAQFPSRNGYPEHIPQRLKRTIDRCLRTQSGERFASVIDVVNELADIDGELLDWRYENTPDGKQWTKTADGRYYELLVANDGSSTATRVVSGGNPRRITEYCKPRITVTEIRRFLGGY